MATNKQKINPVTGLPSAGQTLADKRAKQSADSLKKKQNERETKFGVFADIEDPREFMQAYMDDPRYKQSSRLGLVGLASQEYGLQGSYGMVKDELLDRKSMTLTDAVQAQRELDTMQEFTNQRVIDANIKEDMRDKAQQSMVKVAKLGRKRKNPRSLLAQVRSNVANTLGREQTLGA